MQVPELQGDGEAAAMRYLGERIAMQAIAISGEFETITCTPTDRDRIIKALAVAAALMTAFEALTGNAKNRT